MSVFIGYPSFMAYQMMKGKKDNNEGFPTIPGTIARYSALGLTNEQMAENPVWKDLTGNGHDLQMKNFAWGGMSGVGGYVQNFNNFKNNATVDKVRIDEQSSNSIKVTILTTGIGNAIYIPKNIYQFNKSYSIKISSEGYDEGDMALSFYAPSTSTATTVTVSLNPNGITEIPAIKKDDFLAVYINVSGKVGSFTVEQLPLYPGALVFDGVDDWAGCDNLPLLPKEKGYSIIALRNWITRYDATQYKRPLISNLDTNDEGAFLIEYRKDENVNDVTGSYNSFTDVYIDDNNPITWQTSSSYNGQIIKKGTSKSTNKLCICKTYFGQLSNYANAAIWEIVILDHDATEEELTKIKDYFVKTYPWLFPDQAWTVTGKTNEDEDRATIANITGNGNDLVLSNVAFSENSGYGSYPFGMNVWNPDYIADQPYGTVHYLNDSKSYATTVKNNATNFRIKFRLRGLPEGGSFLIRVFDMNDLNTALKTYTYTENGIHEFVYNDPNKPARIILYNGKTPSNISEFYLDIIPEYEGYLVTDGVDDKAVSKQFKFGENFTVILDFKFPVKKISYCGFDLSSKVRIQNLQGSGVYVVLKGNKTLIPSNVVRAVTSEGKVYDENWNEYNIVPGNISSNYTMVNLGFDGSNQFAESATKLAGIYSSTLSKDDCIKAYNYLQTLKAK